MQLFTPIYQKMICWSQHRFAPFWLAFVSFIEAIFFPIPPDVMLMPMTLTQPHKAWRFALMAGVSSTVGGIVGYAIGFFATDWVTATMQQLGYAHQWAEVVQWFDRWGVMIVFVAGFSPIPYKVFTLCAGVMQMAFLPFVLAAAISRTARFLLVALLCAWGGRKFADKLPRFIEWIGWATVALAVLVFLYLR